VWPLLTASFALALILIIFFADRGTMPGFIAALYAFPYGDKAGHFLLMGGLAFLVNLSLSCRKVKLAGRGLLLGSLIAAGLVTVEEASQLIFKSRHASLGDLGASLLGILAFGWAAARVNRAGGQIGK
jgi:hypothetical protein